MHAMLVLLKLALCYNKLTNPKTAVIVIWQARMSQGHAQKSSFKPAKAESGKGRGVHFLTPFQGSAHKNHYAAGLGYKMS